MKLCFLANANSIHSFKWIKYFADRDHEIHWISLTKNEFGEIENVKFYLLREFSFKLLDILLNVIPVRRLIKKISPDVLHVHYAGVNGVFGVLSGFRPFILTAWGSDILIAPKSIIIRPLIKFVLKKADLITCDAEHMKNAMIKLRADSSKIRIIYFGIDTEKFRPGPKDEKLIKELGFENSSIVISLRNLEPGYDLQTLIKATPLVLKEFPRVKFIIAGKGSEEKKLKELAKNLDVLESIRFIGWISNDELLRYLRIADVYVSTSLSDAGIASSTAEAMACGLPVVITNSGENEKWIKDGQGGYLVPVKAPEVLAEKIIFLLKNKDAGRKMGMAARKTIEEKNNYYKEMEKMEKIYEKIKRLANKF